MRLREGLEIGARHHLYIGGCDTVALAEEYGTPLYVVDEQYLRGMCRAFVDSVNAYAPGGRVSYASKAFCTMAMCRIVEQERMGLDVVSGGELYTAKQAGFPMDRVTMHGNSKTPDEVRLAISLDVAHIVVDSLSEIAMLQQLAAEQGKIVKLLLRMNPGIAARTHRSVQTAVKDCKFGLDLEDGDALQAAKMIGSCENLLLDGVHVHIGSQIFEVEPYLRATDRLMEFLVLASAVCGRELEHLVIGGGFGVQYTQDDPPTVDPRNMVRRIAEEIAYQAQQHGLKMPRLGLEPGRIIIAESAVALYTVHSIKHIDGVRNYVGIDGGMMDNPRVALYGGRYEALLANRADERPVDLYAIAGRACESGDLLGMDYPLPEPKVGDILAMSVAGAYQYSMASNYNRVPFPAVVLARYSKSALIVARQRYEDIVQYDRMPSWLEMK